MDPTITFRERLIGLQGCAKAVHEAGQTPEQTATAAIRLYDLLVAEAARAAGLTRKDPQQDAREAEGRRVAIERFIRDNHLSRPRFEAWLGTFFPEVREGRLEKLTVEHAKRLLGNPVGCLKAFGEYLVKTSQEGKALVGQEQTPRVNNA